MNLQELEELMALLREQGLKVEACDVPVPVMTEGVSCGKLMPLGDGHVEDYMNVPGSLVRGIKAFVLQLKGDSMAPRYSDGDLVLVEVRETAQEGQNVVAMVNGECMIKTYVRDREGRPWLVPLNRLKYQPTRINDDADFQIFGVVRGHFNLDERESVADALGAVADYEREERNRGRQGAGRPRGQQLEALFADECTDDCRQRLVNVAKGLIGKDLLVLLRAAVDEGWLMKLPSYAEAKKAFGDIGAKSNYYDYCDIPLTDKEKAWAMAIMSR